MTSPDIDVTSGAWLTGQLVDPAVFRRLLQPWALDAAPVFWCVL